MEKLEKLYEGKAKQLYATDDPEVLWVEYKNSATAGDGEKKEDFAGKGRLNNLITTLIFDLLKKRGIDSHLVARVGETSQLVKKVTMFPLEIVLRNTAAGHFCSRLGVEEGIELKEPVLEYFLKNDDLHDPFVNDDDLVALDVCTREDLAEIAPLARRINEALIEIFAKIDVKLVDFKIEMGRTSDGTLLLADEITPDSCRLWDQRDHSGKVEHLDKDLFRRDLGDIIPALNSHWARVIVGVTLLTFFYVVNLMGVDIMAKAQKMMTWLLIAALILFAIVGIFKMKLPIFDFSDPNFAINGWGITFNNGQISGGFLGAVLLFVYSTQGYYMTTAYGRDSKNARKDIPFVLLLCVPTLCILYVGVAMAGVGVMSVEEYGNSTTLVFAAQRIFPTWLFYFFIIGGPIMALLSTLNSSFAYNSITIGQSCDDGWLPKSFGKKNKSGARPYILTFMYVVGIIPIVFGLSITTITNMVQLITSAFAILNFTAEIKMPKKYPDAWKQSRYHVPDGLYYTICCVSLALFLVVLWKSLLSMNIGLAVINVVVIVIAGLIGFWRSKTGNIEIHTSAWAEDYQEAAES